MQRHSTPRRRVALLLLVAGTALAALVAAAVPTYSIDTRHTGKRDDRGFPLFYTDNRNLSLRMCEDGTPKCLRADRGDLIAPDGENFYWMATAHVPSRLGTGSIDVEFALEAAFAGQRPIVFQRLRIRGHIHKGRYVLFHPYGKARFHAIRGSEQRNVDTTRDRGCSLVKRGRCPGNITNFLRAKNPPKGYVGFGGRRTLVKGGTVRNALILQTRRGKFVGRTSKFAIVGKRAGGLRPR